MRSSNLRFSTLCPIPLLYIYLHLPAFVTILHFLPYTFYLPRFASCLSLSYVYPPPLLTPRMSLSSLVCLLAFVHITNVLGFLFSLSLSLSLFVFLSFLAVCSLLLYLVLPLVSSVLPRVEPLRLALPKLSRSRFKIIQLTSSFHPRASSPSSLPQRRSSSSVLRRTRYLPLATLYTRIHTYTPTHTLSFSLSLSLTYSLSLPFSRTLPNSRNPDCGRN